MSGRNSKPGLTVFSIVEPGRSTRGRRQRANAMLIAYRRRAHTALPMGAPLEQWLAYQSWRLKWEAAIIGYRDGNSNNERTNQ